MRLRNCVTASALTLLVVAVPAMAKSSKSKDGGEINQQFARFDRNGDGLITRAEFPADASFFDRLDLNRDGALTRGEVEQAVPDRAAAERQLRAYDRNGDGIISRSEFPGDAAAFNRLDRNRDGVLSQADRAGNGKQMRHRGMDRNGDGVISRDEWRGNENSFRKQDRNGDGILSGNEVRGRGRKHDRNRRDDDDDEEDDD